MDQTTKAESFNRLHHGAQILVLPNAWDGASAAIVADAGAKAIATSSAAVAWINGFADGDKLPRERLLTNIATVAKAAGDLPVTADIEGGYTDDLDELAEVIARVIEAGAVGINFEDGARDPGLHARKIEAARKAADATGVPLFINARIDVYLKGLAEGHAAYVDTVARARSYQGAGADGIFVPGPSDDDLIGRLAEAIEAPLNILLWPGLSPAERLQSLGVRRLSAGATPMRFAYAQLKGAVEQFLAEGSTSAFAGAEGMPNLNQRFGEG
jgi:2-methylisocitrate lyase-like PEP mutase family enzyme